MTSSKHGLRGATGGDGFVDLLGPLSEACDPGAAGGFTPTCDANCSLPVVRRRAATLLRLRGMARRRGLEPRSTVSRRRR